MQQTNRLGKYSRILILVLSLLLLCFYQPNRTSAGTNIWTGNGPEGGGINILVVDPTDSDDVYAGTDGGGVYKSTDGGDNWSTANSGLDNKYVRSLVIDPTDTDTL